MSDFEPQTDGEFTWSAHPAAERLGHAALAAGVVLMVAMAVWFSFDSLAWGVAALLVLVAALNRFFFPSRFTIDKKGITASYLLARRRLLWQQLKRFAHDEQGGFLSTRAQPSRLDAYRGMHILFGAHRDEVIQQIHAHRAEQKSGIAATSDHQTTRAADPHGKAAA